MGNGGPGVPTGQAGTTRRLGGSLAVVAAVILLAAVVAVAWFPSPPSTGQAHVLEAVVGAGVALWLASLALARRAPAIPVGLIAVVGAVIALGWFLVWNARSRYQVEAPHFVPVHRPFPALPGSKDRAASVQVMEQLTAVLAGGLALADLARHRWMRSALLWAMAATGAGLALVGTLDRFGVSPVSFTAPPGVGGTPFATFAYHGNAAAYLNLVLPAGLAVAVIGVARGTGWARWLAGALPVTILVGIAANVSKAGQALALPIVVVFALAALRLPRRRPATRSVRRAAVLVTVCAVALTVAGVVGAWYRWRDLGNDVGPGNGRSEIWQTAWHAGDGARWFGNGPGSFKLVLPDVARSEVPGLYRVWIVTTYVPGQRVSTWMVADNDALQTLAEWGAVGLALLATIALWPVARSLRRGRGSLGWTDGVVRVAGLVALGGVFVDAMIDFPLQVMAVAFTAVAWGAVLLGLPATNGRPVRRGEPRRRRSSTAEP